MFNVFVMRFCSMFHHQLFTQIFTHQCFLLKNTKSKRKKNIHQLFTHHPMNSSHFVLLYLHLFFGLILLLIHSSSFAQASSKCQPVPLCPASCDSCSDVEWFKDKKYNPSGTMTSAGYKAWNFIKQPFIYHSNAATCGDINVEYPLYHDENTCPDPNVRKAMSSAIDITSFSIASVLASDYGGSRVLSGLKKILDGNTKLGDQGSATRAAGDKWFYRQNVILQQPAARDQGYYFAKVSCDKGERLNVTEQDEAPNLMTTALVMNAALVVYATYAVTAIPQKEWPISSPLITDHLTDFAITLTLGTVASAYIQEQPSRNSDDLTFETNSASHAVVLHVVDFALQLQSQNLLPLLTQDIVQQLIDLKNAAASHVVLSCSRTTDNENPAFGAPEPLIEGFRVYWESAATTTTTTTTTKPTKPTIHRDIEENEDGKKNETEIVGNDTSSTEAPPPSTSTETISTSSSTETETTHHHTTTESTHTTSTPSTTTSMTTSTTTEAPQPPAPTPSPTIPPPSPIPSSRSRTTSIFLAALGGSRLNEYCTGHLGQTGGLVADALMKRNLAKYGVMKAETNGRPNSDVYLTEGIAQHSPTGRRNNNYDNCTIDVEETAWLDIAAQKLNALTSAGCAKVASSLATSSPYLRTFCRNHSSITSWQNGHPLCGNPMTSTALTSLTAANLLSTSIFRPVPTTPAPRTTASPPTNNNGDDSGAMANIEQAVIGLSFGVAILFGGFCVVRYLKKQAHHRNARLEGGMVREGHQNPSDLGYGTYNGVTSNTFM